MAGALLQFACIVMRIVAVCAAMVDGIEGNQPL